MKRRYWVLAAAAVLAGGLVLYKLQPLTLNEYLARSDAHLVAGRAQEAIIDAKSALQLDPESGRARFALARALVRNSEFLAAAVEFEKALKADHPAGEVYPLLAEALMRGGRPQLVVQGFESVTLAQPVAMAAVKAALATAYSALNAPDKADRLAAEALALDADNAVAGTLVARRLASRGQADAALKQLDVVIAKHQALSDPHVARGDILWWMKRDEAAATAAFEHALKLEPRLLSAHRSLIWLALSRKDTPLFEKRADALRKALPNHPDAYMYQAQLALLKGQYPQARELVQQVLRRAPNDARALTLAGAIELAGGSATVAVNHLSKAVSVAPGSTPARQKLAQAYTRIGDPTRALATLQPLMSRGTVDPETLSSAASAFLVLGQLDRAEALFRQLAQHDPKDARARTALALSQIAKGHSEDGFARLEALAQEDSGVGADLALISARVRAADYVGALAAAARLESKQPTSPLGSQVRGLALLQRQDNAGARAAFEKALSMEPGFYPAVAQLVQLDLLAGKTTEALGRLESHLERAPRDYTALQAWIGLKLKQDDSAKESVVKRLQQVVQAQPGDAAPRLLQTDVLIGLKRFSAALSAAQDAAQAMPNEPQVQQALARAQLASGDVLQAVATSSKVAAASPGNPELWMRLAEAQRANKSRADAARSYERALEADPRHLPAQRALINLAIEDKRVAAAVQIAKSIQQQRPKDVLGFQLESDIHLAARQPQAAIAALRQALTVDTSNATAVKVHALMALSGKPGEADGFANQWLASHPKDASFQSHLALMAIQRLDLAAASQRLRAALDIEPRNPLFLNNLAWVLNQQRKPGGLELAKQALDLAPRSASFMDTYAQSLAVADQLPQAVEWQRKAVAAAGASQEVANYRLNLARLLARQGDQPAARAELAMLKKLGKSHPLAEEANKLEARL